MTPPSIYLYFPDRKSLLRDVVADRFSDFARRLSREWAPTARQTIQVLPRSSRWSTQCNGAWTWALMPAGTAISWRSSCRRGCTA
ncbi:MAG: TetR/AcrR family transcriptional regulator [Geodermatophilaceae bacterium]|nr:TetR/AcrR family transcriptional regulator [Geodermatophilaceae bacterium]